MIAITSKHGTRDPIVPKAKTGSRPVPSDPRFYIPNHYPWCNYWTHIFCFYWISTFNFYHKNIFTIWINIFWMLIEILNINIIIQCKCGILQDKYYFLQHKWKIIEYKYKIIAHKHIYWIVQRSTRHTLEDKLWIMQSVMFVFFEKVDFQRNLPAYSCCHGNRERKKYTHQQILYWKAV